MSLRAGTDGIRRRRRRLGSEFQLGELKSLVRLLPGTAWRVPFFGQSRIYHRTDESVFRLTLGHSDTFVIIL